MSDEIIEELWRIKDSIAQEYGYDIEALVAYLQTKEKVEGRQIVDLSAIKKTTEQGASAAIEDSGGAWRCAGPCRKFCVSGYGYK